MTVPQQQIFLIRHARPEVSRKGWFNQAMAAAFLSAYDEADVEAFAQALHDLQLQPAETVYCSTLNRSRATARRLFGEKVRLVEDPVFREFERKIVQLPFIRLPLPFWLVTSRLLWLLGLNSKGIETFRQARARARAGAGKLQQAAAQDGTAVLVAHGLLNRFIRKALQEQGWQVLRKGGRGYLGVTELTRPHPEGK